MKHAFLPVLVFRPFLLAMATWLCGCTNGDEVARIRSPDNLLDAVVVEDSAGATTDFWYDVCVVRPGRSACNTTSALAVLYGASRSPVASGVDVAWSGNEKVVVKYMAAKRVTLRKPAIHEGNKTVVVELQSGAVNQSAPGGSMWRTTTSSEALKPKA